MTAKYTTATTSKRRRPTEFFTSHFFEKCKDARFIILSRCSMQIDVSSVPEEPKLLGRACALNQHPYVGWSGISVFFATHDEHRALHIGNVIDRPQLQRRNAKPPLQLTQ